MIERLAGELKKEQDRSLTELASQAVTKRKVRIACSHHAHALHNTGSFLFVLEHRAPAIAVKLGPAELSTCESESRHGQSMHLGVEKLRSGPNLVRRIKQSNTALKTKERP